MPTNLTAAAAAAIITSADVSSSLKRKEEGNRFFANKRYSAAVACYRSGLDGLPSYNGQQGGVGGDGDILNLEVGLRSNIALCYLRLAQSSSPSPQQQQQQTQLLLDEDKQREYYLQVIQECSIALQLDSSSPKLFHRRGMARQLLAEQQQQQQQQQTQCSENDDDNDDCESSLWNLAEEDFTQSVQILEQQQQQQQQQNDNASKKQLADACKVLEKLRVAKRKSQEVLMEQQQQQQQLQKMVKEEVRSDEEDDGWNTDNTSVEQQQSSVVVFPQMMPSNGHAIEESSNDRVEVVSSPQTQRENILQLLSKSSSATPSLNNTNTYSGEAYFLIDMDWWQSWCCYVGLFSMYNATSGDKDNDSSSNVNNEMNPKEIIEQHCKQIDISNQQILQLFPPGATLPLYLEQDRTEALRVKKKKNEENINKKNGTSGDSSSSSTTSSEDSDDDESVGLPPPLLPGVIDNSSLILPNNNEGWCCDIESSTPDEQQQQRSTTDTNQGGKNNDDISDDDSNVLLRSHLVRGYHFELLPREVYVALHSWYGETSPPIVRRVVVPGNTLDDAAGGTNNKNNNIPRVELYSEHWDIIARRNDEMMKQRPPSLGSSNGSSSSKTSLKCSACGSPSGKSACRKCGVARYCDRQCQVNHWSYHKKFCSTINNQQQEGGDGGSSLDNANSVSNHVLDSAWGRVGLNNLGNTCFLNSAVQVSLRQ